MTFEVLVVCTANICRSPATARALRVGLKAHGVPEESVRVTSAGVNAMTGSPMCEVSETETDAALSGWPLDPMGSHSSRPLTTDIATQASLILTADRQHRRSILTENPRLRQKVFTIRQAARLANWLVSEEGSFPVALARAAGQEVDLDPLDHRSGVPQFPLTEDERFQWFAAEIDASRGVTGPTDDERAQWPAWDTEDIGDPHVEGFAMHPDAVAAAVTSALAIASALGSIYHQE